MATEKFVSIGVGTEEAGDHISIDLARVTEVKESEEIDSDMVKTFDEAVPVPSSDGGFTIDISALEAQELNKFINLKKILKRMKSEAGTLQVIENVKHKQGNFTTKRNYSNVLLSSNEVTLSAEDLTARDLSFNAGSCKEYINDELI